MVSSDADACGQGREKAIALLTAREIFDLVRDDLVQVEQELARQTSVAFEPSGTYGHQARR